LTREQLVQHLQPLLGPAVVRIKTLLACRVCIDCDRRSLLRQ
jgi:hypothetical protein